MIPRSIGIRAIDWTGWLLLASGLLHVVVWSVQGGAWEGPLAWRKPILFGVSAGVTALSIAWVLRRLPPRFADGWLAVVFAAAMLGEVGLITMQTWRGVASHFNRTTPVDAAVLSGIEWLILIVTGVILELTRRSWGKISAAADMRLAMRAGLIGLSFACLLGFWLVWHGEQQIARGLSPERFGAQGVMKFPHGVPIHALQLLPCWALLLRRCGWPELTRWRSMVGASAAVLVMTVVSLAQTLLARARFDFTVGTAVLMALVVLCCLASLAVLAIPDRTGKLSSNLRAVP
jgi:hypothetical protein